MLEVWALIFGCLIGSFLNVCIYRVPRKESVVHPPSHCPNCNHKIKWYENIPLISYIIILKGKCSSCKKKISIRYPLVELMTGVVYYLCALKFGYSYWTPVSIVVATLLVFGSMVDIDHMYIPNRVSISIMLIGIFFSIVNGFGIERAILGGAIYAFPFLLIYGYGADIYKKEVLGFGDVKLAAALGMFLGYHSLLIVNMFITVSFALGTIIALILIGLKIKSKTDAIPFGPYIALGSFVTLLYFY